MIELVDFLKNNGLEALKTQFGIKVSRHGKYPNLVSLKYNQIDSPKDVKIVQQCRGIILDENNNWKIIGRAFDRFFNYGEGFASEIDWQSASVAEKLDGCCDADTLINTDKGEYKISEICKNISDFRVMSFDHFAQELVFDDIVSFSVQSNNEDWYEIELENGKKIKLTGNHKVWLEDLGCYRSVKYLNEGDKVLCFE